MQYLHQLFCKLIPSLTTNDVLINRAHRIHKPQHLPASIPRDILAQMHFFHVEKNIMQAARSLYSLPEPFDKISLYNDTSAATSQACKSFPLVTSVLNEHKLPYKWIHPTKLLVTYHNQQASILTPKDGVKQLNNWGIISCEPPPNPKTGPSTTLGPQNLHHNSSMP